MKTTPNTKRGGKIKVVENTPMTMKDLVLSDFSTWVRYFRYGKVSYHDHRKDIC